MMRNLSDALQSGIVGVLALLFVGAQVFLFVGGMAYRKDCLSAAGQVTSDWTFQWSAPVPYVFRPSEQSCEVHTATRVALNAVGIAGFDDPSTLSVAEKLSESTDNEDLAYFGRLKAILVEYGDASERSRSIGEGEQIVRAALDRLSELTPTPRYRAAHTRLERTLRAIGRSAIRLRRAITSADPATRSEVVDEQRALAMDLNRVYEWINVIHAGDQ